MHRSDETKSFKGGAAGPLILSHNRPRRLTLDCRGSSRSPKSSGWLTKLLQGKVGMAAQANFIRFALKLGCEGCKGGWGGARLPFPFLLCIVLCMAEGAGLCAAVANECIRTFIFSAERAILTTQGTQQYM